jgi:hypothetical protein
MEDRVGDFWDALVLGQEPAARDLDPVLAATVVRFQALADAPPEDARERVRRRLGPLAATGTPAAPPFPRDFNPQPSGSAANADGAGMPDGGSRWLWSPRPVGAWARSSLATAALLLCTLALGLAAVLLRDPRSQDEPGPSPALIAAIAAVADAPAPELLASVDFTADQLSAEEPEAIFYRLILPPDGALPYLGGTLDHDRGWVAPAGVGAEVVETGSYAVRIGAPILVHPGDPGGERDIPAGTEVVLGPGDAVAYPDYGAPATIRATGDGPTVVLGVAVVPAGGEAVPMPDQPEGVSGESLSRSNAGEWAALATGPVRVSLWRLEIPAGGRVGPYEATGLEALRVERGAIERGFVRSGESEPSLRPRFYPAGRTAPFAATSPGVRRVIANVGDEPAVVVALAIEPLVP